MDLKCPKCGEPWDFDSLHEETEDRFPGLKNDAYQKKFRIVQADFLSQGCKALGSKCNGNEAHPGISALYDLLGDDLDGAANLIEDFNL